MDNDELQRRLEDLEDRIAHRCQNCTCPDFTIPTRRLERLKMRIRLAATANDCDKIIEILDEDTKTYREQ